MVSAGMDTDLPLLQRVLIRIHLAMCRRCARVHGQLLSLRAYGRHLRPESGPQAEALKLAPETRQRIKRRLQQARERLADPSPTTSEP